MHTPQQLELVWRKSPPNAIILNGRVIPLEDEVGTAIAAKLLAKSQRRIQSMCDEGILVEGQDWRRAPTLTGRSHYQIRRTALEKMKA